VNGAECSKLNSRYYEYDILTSTTATELINTQRIYSEDMYGLPVTLKSDNGPQFKSDEFKRFCEENVINNA